MKKGLLYRTTAKLLIVSQLAQLFYIPFAVSKQTTTNEASVNKVGQSGLNYVNQSAEAWLNQYGTAKVQTGYNFETETFTPSSIDFLLPFFDSEKDVLFTQFGYRYEDSTDTLNFGLGYRHNFEQNLFGSTQSLIGINAFYDRNMKDKVDRIGLGAEYFTDYLRLTTNGYFRLSDWKDVDTHFDKFGDNTLQARAANGFDIKLDSYLPSYPHIGMNLKYEQYFGDDVDLFKQDTLQTDPHAFTLGLNYTPIPLMTWEVSHTEGKSNLSDTKATLALNYRFGVPIEAQLNPSNVKQMRQVSTSRYDLVDRNSTIVMAYRQKQQEENTPEITLPEKVAFMEMQILKNDAIANGVSTNEVAVSVRDADNQPLENVVIKLNNVLDETIDIQTTDEMGDVQFTINSFIPGIMRIEAIVVGNESKRASSEINFVDELSFENATMNLVALKDNALADGIDEVQLQAKLLDKNGQPLSNIWIDVHTTNTTSVIDTVQTDSNGQALVSLSSNDVVIKGIYVNVRDVRPVIQSNVVQVYFNSNPLEADRIFLSLVENNAVANGIADNIVQAVLVGENNNPLHGVDVRFYDDEAPSIDLAVSSTDIDGRVNFNIASTIAGVKTIGAQVVAKPEVRSAVFVTFQAIPGEVTMTVSDGPKLANGQEAFLITATVLDPNGMPVKNINVDIVGDNGEIIRNVNNQQLRGVTDIDGQIIFNLASITAQTIGIAAIVDESTITSARQEISFIADISNAQIESITAAKNTLIANGEDTTDVTVRVTDNFNNALSNYGDIIVSDSRGNTYNNPFTTGDNGTFNIPIASAIEAGDLVLSVTLPNNQTAQTTITFEQLIIQSSISLSTDDLNVIADGINSTIIRGTALDQYGFALANQPVTVSDNRGWNAGAVITDSNGEFVITTLPASNIVTQVTVTATLVNEPSVSSSTIMYFNGDLLTMDIYSLTADDLTMIANSDESTTLRAIVKDNNGLPVINQQVTFSGQDLPIIGVATTDENGLATMTFNARLGTGTFLRPLGVYEINAVLITPDQRISNATLFLDFLYSDQGINIFDIQLMDSTHATFVSTFHYTVKDEFGNPALIGYILNAQLRIGHSNDGPLATYADDILMLAHYPITQAGIGRMMMSFGKEGDYRLTIFTPLGVSQYIDITVLPGSEYPGFPGYPPLPSVP